uniref:G protein-coupled receptor 20 n=1 Tax=Fundulus heteroclitus TaxID=8078 RepID=A0A3Q2P7J6_FUNHE
MELLLPNISSSSGPGVPLPRLTASQTNCSTWDPQWGSLYLHKLAHLDLQLYQDFYSVWVFLMVCNSLMLVLGVVLNILALWVFCGTSTRSSASVVYTMNLAVADLLVALSLPARIALYHSGGSCVACAYVHTFSYFVNMYCSILFLTSICVDRYLAVVHAASTLHRWRTTGAAKCISAVVWFIAVVVTYSFQVNLSCSHLPTHFYLTILEFLLPMLAVVGFTLRVACFLSSSHRPMPRHSRARRTRAVRLLAAVLMVFTICFTPFHLRQALVYIQVRLAGGGDGQLGAGHVLAYHITVSLSSLNSCLDPVVYCFVTDSFRRMWRTRRRRRTKGDEDEEEEAKISSGGEGVQTSFQKCPGTALAIAQSVATLTLSSTVISAVTVEQLA